MATITNSALANKSTTFEHRLVNTDQGLTIACDCFGEPSHPCVLLIMGLGAQMRVWPDSLCSSLAAHGFYVVRFDNRDSGDSSYFDQHGHPNIAKTWLFSKIKYPTNLAYRLDDMADDITALLDALNIDSAHLVGASMGGMIAQLSASRQCGRIKSLTSIMSAAQSPVLRPRLKVLIRLLQRPTCSSQNIAIQYTMTMNDLIGSPGFPMEKDELLEIATVNYERNRSETGYLRQLAAIMEGGDQRQCLRRIRVPTLVIHGHDDVLIPPAMGRAIAKGISHSRYIEIPGMGHNLPNSLVPKLVGYIAEHLKKAESPTPSN